ncbi:MAG: hypothetical protein L0221_10895 [Chloroflexi bacterium]|nr:hypothetical protein [Chloroflexota bacterium]
MTPTEIAFLALGVVLGVAGGAAVVVVFRSHASPHEVKVTVARDAVPRRASTLSIDAFHSPAEVARGGPADRRSHDRDFPATNDPPRLSELLGFRTPVLATGTLGGGPAQPAAPPDRPRAPEPRATMDLPMTLRAALPLRDDMDENPFGIRIAPEPDPDLASLRASMAVAAEQAGLTGSLTAAAILQPAGAVTEVAVAPALPVGPAEPAIRPILRGDRRALVRVVAALAPADKPVERIRWQRRLVELVNLITRAAIDDGMLILPEGHRFWDPFDRDQTRDILRALAAHGHRPDGAGGWEDGREPTGRQLLAALADAGLDPRRIRPWPIEDRIADLVTHATVAADEYISMAAPTLELIEVQAIVASVSPAAKHAMADLWLAWPMVRELLLLEPDDLVERSGIPAPSSSSS